MKISPLHGRDAGEGSPNRTDPPGRLTPSLDFGHFQCRVAASEDRPAFQGRSRQPNPLTRRRATNDIANPNGCEIQAPLTRRGFLPWVTQVPALKGRPTVNCRDAAAKEAFFVPNKYHRSENACLMLRT